MEERTTAATGSPTGAAVEKTTAATGSPTGAAMEKNTAATGSPTGAAAEAFDKSARLMETTLTATLEASGTEPEFLPGARVRGQLIWSSTSEEMFQPRSEAGIYPSPQSAGAWRERESFETSEPRSRYISPSTRAVSMGSLREQLGHVSLKETSCYQSMPSGEWVLQPPKLSITPQAGGAPVAEAVQRRRGPSQRQGGSLPSSPAAPARAGSPQLRVVSPTPTPGPGPTGRWQGPQTMPTAQIPPGWAFYPGQGWVQCQWTPASPAWGPPLQPQPQAPWPAQALPVAPAQVPAPRPPPLETTFDGTPMKLTYFLNCIQLHFNEYGHRYATEREMTNAITRAMKEGEAAEWVAEMHQQEAPELDNFDDFIQAVTERFEDTAQRERAEAEIKKIKQRGRHPKEYVWEFRRVAGKLRDWPDRLLIHYFKEGLDPELRKACGIRGAPERIHEWYHLVVVMHLELYPHWKAPVSKPARKVPARQPAATKPRSTPGTSTRHMMCFRCGQVGHRASECLAPAPVPLTKPGTVAKPETAPARKPKDRGKFVKQALETPAEEPKPRTSPDSPELSDDDGSDDPMVSVDVPPFVLEAKLTVPSSGKHKSLDALLDTGCTRCLVSQAIVKELGIRTQPLPRPIRFEQADGSLMGGAPATLMTEPLRFELNDHWEMIRLVVAPKMTDPLMLGLSWLDKWGPTISWEKGFRKLKIPPGPDPRPANGLPTLQYPLCPTGKRDKTMTSLEATADLTEVPLEYRDLAEVFSKQECNILPPHRPTDCAIEFVPGATLPKPKMYSMTPREMTELRKYIDENLARGFIQPANSRVAAPVLFREKKDGSLRLCIDLRGINAVSVQNTYPLPLMKDLLNHLKKGKIFTKLDLREAYYRVRIREGDEWKTAFNCPLGSFQFKVMPFGLQGAPAVFMQLINEVLHEHLYQGVLVYLDDILIFSETLEEHVKLVRQVLEKLLAAKLYAKLSKCEFHRKAIDYLGYRISSGGIEMDPKKVAAVLDWQAPRTRKQLQSFLGFANFYRQFIPAFAQVALPLTELLKTGEGNPKPKPGQPLQWTMTCQKAFEMLKQLFAKEPVLQHPDPEKPFVVQTDASDVAVAAVLLQEDPKGQLLPCAYVSKKLTDTERRWPVWEKEAFAIRWALLSWRHFLEGSKIPFQVWTDHKNLEALKNPRKLSPKQVRWAQYFKRFDFELKYIPGGKNVLADALSRKPQFDSQREEVVQPMLAPSQPVAQVTTRARAHQRDRHPLTGDIIAALTTDPWFLDNKDSLTTRDGLAWKGTKIYVPTSVRIKVLERCHDAKSAGHFGFLKTLHLVRKQFWWPRLKPEVEDYTKSCVICATMKGRPGKPPGLLQTVAEPSRPWEEIGMDFIVDLPTSDGKTVIWTVIDLFSKQAHFVACSGLPTAKKLAKLFIQHIYRLHGAPKRIISDRGVQFTAKFWRQFLKSIGTAQGLSSGFHPATNGAAEKANALVEQYLRCYVDYQQSNWSELLPFAEVAYNNAVHSSTGLTPFQVTSGIDFVPIPELPQSPPSSMSLQEWMDFVKEGWEKTKTALKKSAKAYKKQADKHRSDPVPFRVGEKVYLSTKYLKLKIPSKKLGPKFLGPFPIVKIINPVTVQLSLPRLLGKVHPVFHSSLLKRRVESQTRPPTAAPPSPVIVQGQRHYEVKKILDSKILRGVLMYLVQWKGYPLSEASWVKSHNISADRLVKKFHEEFPNKPKGPPGGGKGG